MRGTSCFAYADFCPEVVSGWAKHEYLTCVRRVGLQAPEKDSIAFFYSSLSFQLSGGGFWICMLRKDSEETERERRGPGTWADIRNIFPLFFFLFNGIRPLIHALLMPKDLQKAWPVKQAQHAKPAAPCTPVRGAPYGSLLSGSSESWRWPCLFHSFFNRQQP